MTSGSNSGPFSRTVNISVYYSSAGAIAPTRDRRFVESVRRNWRGDGEGFRRRDASTTVARRGGGVPVFGQH